MAQSDPNMTQIAVNDPKWPKMTKNGSGMTLNDPKWPKNDPKWPKMTQNDKK